MKMPSTPYYDMPLLDSSPLPIDNNSTDDSDCSLLMAEISTWLADKAQDRILEEPAIASASSLSEAQPSSNEDDKDEQIPQRPPTPGKSLMPNESDDHGITDFKFFQRKRVMETGVDEMPKQKIFKYQRREQEDTSDESSSEAEPTKDYKDNDNDDDNDDDNNDNIRSESKEVSKNDTVQNDNLEPSTENEGNVNDDQNDNSSTTSESSSSTSSTSSSSSTEATGAKAASANGAKTETPSESSEDAEYGKNQKRTRQCSDKPLKKRTPEILNDNNTGQSVLDVAFRHLNLLETAYFGLRFLDPEGQTHWLDPAKKLSRQLKGPDPYTLYFGVKFYAADPCKLLEEITRYQFFLQVKQDILQGRLPVTFELAAELGAYIIQSELGDYDPRRHSPGYVSEFRFLSNQTLELESRIAELHKSLIGQLPSVAELNYLDKVKWLDMYGVDLHPVLGEDNVEYFLGLTPSGIIVLRNKNTVGNYYWPRISKIYFKGRYFMLRVTDKNNDENTYGFETPSKAACKHLWKCCVEHHAFFRLVQVSPTTPDIFALGSRFRYSGRTEKQAVRDAQLKVRTPPPFSRTPSRRYQRRIVEGANDTSQAEETVKIDHYQSSEIKHVSIPQPAQSFDSPYRATCNTSTTDVRHRSDSPRSTRSAPWSQPHSRGLYNSSVPPSPRSVRSAGPRYRSSSVDSQSSNDSRSCKSRRKHRSRMTSDNESELSKGSNRSHRKHRRHRSRGNRRDSGSEQESTSHRRKSRSRRSDSHYELVDSGPQWREVQRKHSTEGALTQQSTLITNKRSGYTNSGMESESELSYRKHRRQRKHRSRSRSPDSKVWLPDELKKHLEFNLIDTSGMSESQLREIPYTVVQTNNAKQMKIKQLQWGKGDGSSPNEKRTESPPPPYSPQISEANRVRMRVNHSSLKAHSPSGNADLISMTTSSIASNSSTQSNPNLLPRMLDSLSIADNYSFNGSQRSGKSSRVGSSALYGNPNTLLGGLSNGYQDSDSTRVSHEHTDSGLGGEQDLAYSSERSSDSTKQGQGTNKGNCGESRIGLIPVSKSFTSDYQPLNPQQLYPSHSSNMAGSRAKQALNAGKSSVYKQEADSRYGQFKPSRITYNAYNASNNAATTHLEGVSHKQQADARPIFIRTGSKTSNASSNSHLTDHNTSSLRGSLRSIASNPVTNGNETGPLRVQYRMGSSLRSKCSVISDTKSEFDDNYIYSSHITDTNQNINEFSQVTSSINQTNAAAQTATSSPLKNGDTSEMSTEL